MDTGAEAAQVNVNTVCSSPLLAELSNELCYTLPWRVDPATRRAMWCTCKQLRDAITDLSAELQVDGTSPQPADQLRSKAFVRLAVVVDSPPAAARDSAHQPASAVSAAAGTSRATPADQQQQQQQQQHNRILRAALSTVLKVKQSAVRDGELAPVPLVRLEILRSRAPMAQKRPRNAGGGSPLPPLQHAGSLSGLAGCSTLRELRLDGLSVGVPTHWPPVDRPAHADVITGAASALSALPGLTELRLGFTLESSLLGGLPCGVGARDRDPDSSLAVALHPAWMSAVAELSSLQRLHLVAPMTVLEAADLGPLSRLTDLRTLVIEPVAAWTFGRAQPLCCVGSMAQLMELRCPGNQLDVSVLGALPALHTLQVHRLVAADDELVVRPQSLKHLALAAHSVHEGQDLGVFGHLRLDGVRECRLTGTVRLELRAFWRLNKNESARQLGKLRVAVTTLAALPTSPPAADASRVLQVWFPPTPALHSDQAAYKIARAQVVDVLTELAPIAHLFRKLELGHACPEDARVLEALCTVFPHITCLVCTLRDANVLDEVEAVLRRRMQALRGMFPCEQDTGEP